MVKSPEAQSTNVDLNEDEIDIFKIVRFINKSKLFWISGVLIATLFSLIYTKTLTPYKIEQGVINDIGLSHEKLQYILKIIPAFVFPYKDKMKADGFSSLYSRITNNENFLSSSVKAIDKDDGIINTISNTGGMLNMIPQIGTVQVILNGKDTDLLRSEALFIINTIRNASQYLGVQEFLENKLQESKKVQIEASSKINYQQLNLSFLKRKIKAYDDLKGQASSREDLEIILNINNVQDKGDNTSGLNLESSINGAQYLPISNRILALKSEMTDLEEAIFISKLELEAIDLMVEVINSLNIEFQRINEGQEIKFKKLDKIIEDNRNKLSSQIDLILNNYLNDIERKIYSYEVDGLKLRNYLPAIMKHNSHSIFILISGLIGGLIGIIIYGIFTLNTNYLRRLKN